MNLDVQTLFNNSFVITVNKDRYNCFKKRFELAKLKSPKLFDGFKLSLNKDYYGVKFNSNSFFCFLSHCAIVKTASALGLDYVMIFEDDAVPHKCAIELMKKSFYEIPDDTDILKCGWTVLRNNNFIKYNDNLNSNVITWGAHAYIVFKKYYDKYMEVFRKDPGTDTTLLNYDGNVYTTKENIFIQYNDDKITDQLHNLKNKKFNEKNNINIYDYFI